MSAQYVGKKKKTLISMAIFLIVWIVFFSTDYNRIKSKKSPIFCLPVAMYKDGGSVDYLGLFYKVERNVVDFYKATKKEAGGFEYSISPWFVNTSN